MKNNNLKFSLVGGLIQFFLLFPFFILQEILNNAWRGMGNNLGLGITYFLLSASSLLLPVLFVSGALLGWIVNILLVLIERKYALKFNFYLIFIPFSIAATFFILIWI